MVDRRDQYPDLSNSALASLEAFESKPLALGNDSPEIYTLIRGLQRQLHLQRAKLDFARSKIGETEMKLRQVSADLMTSQEMERRRIASDLHDSIGQSLTALSFGVGSALEASRRGDCVASAEGLTVLVQQVRDTLEEVRRIARNLRPAMLDDLGIVGTMSWFFREFRRVHANFDLQAEINVAESDVPVTLRTPIFRVVQEALTNVVKHSGATEILVAMSCDANGIALEITDNGRGFVIDPEGLNGAAVSVGFGLTGMRDRVEFSGGDFSLQSVPGQGTLISCNWSEPGRHEMTGETP